MGKQRRGMTLIEMVICLAIIAICLLALVKGYSNLTLLSQREAEDAVLVSQIEHLICELEAVTPKDTQGVLKGPWHYRTHDEDSGYSLEVWHEKTHERYVFMLREGPL